MDAIAWMWLVIVLALTWGVPIALFFRKSKVDRTQNEVWVCLPYEHLKFRKGSEIIGTILVIEGIFYLVWFAERSGFLALY